MNINFWKNKYYFVEKTWLIIQPMDMGCSKVYNKIKIPYYYIDIKKSFSYIYILFMHYEQNG
jgi:hypothetical protein